MAILATLAFLAPLIALTLWAIYGPTRTSR
jgi:hypothetical protein